MVAIRCCFFEGYFMARRSLRRVAMPFLQASLVKQILIGLILGIALAYLAPEAAKACAFLGSLFIAALASYAFARMDFPGKALFFTMVLCLMMMGHLRIILLPSSFPSRIRCRSPAAS